MMNEKLSFADILLEPQHSTIRSRSEVDLSVELPKGFRFHSPITPANMKSIVGEGMIRMMAGINGLCLMHRFLPIDFQIKSLKFCQGQIRDLFESTGVSIGVKSSDQENLKAFVDIGVKIVCIDIAHLDSVQGLEMVSWVAKNYPDLLLIAGNVATGQAARRAWENGADVVKVGIGSSGICSTRLETGAGVPQLSAIMDVAHTRFWLQNANKNRKFSFISDGGCRKTGDIVKALCYADMVMIGGMLSGSSATPSETIELNGHTYKTYSGSSTHKDNRIEGVKGLVKPKGLTESIIQSIHEGIQSGCSYQNVRNLTELKENPAVIRITNSGIEESSIHDVLVVE